MQKPKKIPLTLIILLFSFFALAPYIWEIITSFTPPLELANNNVFIPSNITIENYKNVFEGRPFQKYIYNSVYVALVSTSLCIFFASLSAYALSQLKIIGSNIILVVILSLSMLPQISIVSALYKIFSSISLLNTFTVLILVYTTINSPFAIWILAAFFKEIPMSLLESAKVDGSSSFTTFWKIVLPLSLPGIFTASILVFINIWNEFLFGLTFTTDISRQTIPVGISKLPSLFYVPFGDIAAAAVLVTTPLIILVFFLQKKIIHGLTSGAVKG